MATFTKTFLSELPQGGHKTVTTFNGLVHTTLPSSTIIDEVWLYIQNHHMSSEHFIEVYDSSPSLEAFIYIPIPPSSGLVLLIPGLPFSGDGTTGHSIAVIPSDSSANNYLQVTGYVNRITP